MPSKELTSEQRQRRAEIARQNGAKSKGPVTTEGKSRSSMNAIATGEHVELHKEDLPPFYFLLSTDDRSAYLRAFQAQMRHLKPQSEFEQGLVRRMAIALFQHDRLTAFHAEALPRELDTVVREFPALGLCDQFFQSHKWATIEKEVQQFVICGQRHQMATFRSLHKTLIDLRKHPPMQPPEPVDMTADSNQIHDDDPDPSVAVEVIALADRAKKEPSFNLPQYAINFLKNKGYMERLAPGYDVGDVLERFAQIPVPKAA